MTVCSSPPQSNELFHDLSPSIIPIIADGLSPDESTCRLSLRSRICQSSDDIHPQFSDVHANHPDPGADIDTEMTSNNSTGSHTESPPSSSSTASPTSGSFKAAKSTQGPCCSRPRIITKAPQAALTLPPLSSTLDCDTMSYIDSPATDESTATTTMPYRFCTSCDTFMGFSPDAALARRKSSILEPIRVPKIAVNAPAPPPQASAYTQKTLPSQPVFPAVRKPKQMQQQQQGRSPSPWPAPTRFRSSQHPGAGSMDPPPLQRKRHLEPPFEDNGGAKSVRWVSPAVLRAQVSCLIEEQHDTVFTS